MERSGSGAPSDLLTISKETYDHSYNFSHDSSTDKQLAVKVLQQYVL